MKFAAVRQELDVGDVIELERRRDAVVVPRRVFPRLFLCYLRHPGIMTLYRYNTPYMIFSVGRLSL